MPRDGLSRGGARCRCSVEELGARVAHVLVAGRGTNEARVIAAAAVDPYRPSTVYVLGTDRVWRSDNAGGTWVIDTALESQLTEGGAFPVGLTSESSSAQVLLRDMVFGWHFSHARWPHVATFAPVVGCRLPTQ